jgi:hypothetical protein
MTLEKREANARKVSAIRAAGREFPEADQSLAAEASTAGEASESAKAAAPVL